MRAVSCLVGDLCSLSALLANDSHCDCSWAQLHLSLAYTFLPFIYVTLLENRMRPISTPYDDRQ